MCRIDQWIQPCLDWRVFWTIRIFSHEASPLTCLGISSLPFLPLGLSLRGQDNPMDQLIQDPALLHQTGQLCVTNNAAMFVPYNGRMLDCQTRRQMREGGKRIYGRMGMCIGLEECEPMDVVVKRSNLSHHCSRCSCLGMPCRLVLDHSSPLFTPHTHTLSLFRLSSYYIGQPSSALSSFPDSFCPTIVSPDA